MRESPGHDIITARHQRSQAPLAMHPAHEVPLGGAAGDEPRESLWKTLDDRMRGRWRWTVLLALVFGGALSGLGWRSIAPQYRSVGVIRVSPRVPVTLEVIPEVELSKFNMFVNTQVQLIQSRRVLENALDDPDLDELPWSEQTDVLPRLESNLEVATGRDSELIYVAYEADSARVAQAVVNAVIHSYDQIYGQAGGNVVGATLERLRTVEAQFQRQLHQTRTDIARIQHRHETSDLLALQTQTLQRIGRLEQLIGVAGQALERAEADRVIQGEPSPIMLSRLEQLDQQLAVLRTRRDRARTAFDEVRRRYRPTTAAYVTAKREAEIAEALFQDQYLKALDLWEKVPEQVAPGELDELSFAGFSAERLREKLRALHDQEQKLRALAQELVVDLQRLEDLRLKEQRVLSDLERTRNRMQGLELEEQNIAARITVEQEGYRPQSPSSDKRRKRAMMGAAAGGALSFGIFFLWGTVDRRAFGARQLRGSMSQELPVLGVLPDLGRTVLDPEKSDVASHCVHQIRNRIEAFRDPRPGYVMAITSPFQGDGKTSIVLALGWSYALGGSRVLVVDCDLVGRSLTRQLGMIDRPGLREAIIRGETNGLISTLGMDRLHALPVGAESSFGPESVRERDLQMLFGQVCEHYDVIIVDTGPLLGSLESTPVTAAVDGVVLSMRRGRSRTRLEECVQRLRDEGAHCVGLILNCAERSDCNRYVSETSLTTFSDERARRRVPGGSFIDERNALVLAMEMTAKGGSDEATKRRSDEGKAA